MDFYGRFQLLLEPCDFTKKYEKTNKYKDIVVIINSIIMTTIENLNKLLVIAIINNQESECERLIKIGAYINYVDKTDINLLNTALMYYNEYNEYNLNIIKLLVDAGCDINSVNFYGSTPIMISIMFPRYDVFEPHYEVFEYLLQKGANINHKNCNLQNVLFFVVRFVNKSYKLKYCALLIDYGIDVLEIDKYGKRASEYCHDESEVYEYLKQKEEEREMLNQYFKRAQIMDDDSYDDTDDGESEEILEGSFH